MSTRIILFSDTHGSKTGLEYCDSVLSDEKPDYVIHLGDDYTDADRFIEQGFNVIRVPGTWTEEYKNFRVPNRRFEVIEGWRFFLTHTPTAHYNDLADDIDPEKVLTDMSCDIFCHGHTHRPEIIEKETLTILNPGHCNHLDRRGYLPSYAKIDVSTSKACIQIFQLLEREESLSKVLLK